MIGYYNNAIGRPKKKKNIARWGGYHGVTIATACLTGLPAFRNGFDLPLNNILHISCPHYYRDAQPGESEEEYADRLAEDLEQLIHKEDMFGLSGHVFINEMNKRGAVGKTNGFHYQLFLFHLAKD